MNDKITHVAPDFKAAITATGMAMLQSPDRIHVDPVHRFAEGLYCRELTMPAGTRWISKVHKHENFAFIMEGACTVISDEGSQLFVAPCLIKTMAGTQRALQIHDQDCTWITVHAMPQGMDETTEIGQVEDFFACDTLEEYEQHLLTWQAKKEIPQ